MTNSEARGDTGFFVACARARKLAPCIGMMQVRCAISMGSNLGDRSATIRSGIEALGAHRAIQVRSCSSLIETDPIGPPGQGAYMNGAAILKTKLEARELLNVMLRVEREHGRDRSGAARWGPRTLDLDLLIYGDQIIDEPGLCVPHPQLSERLFVLEPLHEIAPDLPVPGQRREAQLTVSSMLKALRARANQDQG